MALDLSKLNFFSKLDARARVFVLFLAIIGIVVLVYLASVYLGGGASTVGPSKVANAPGGLQSIPGGANLTAEYQRALNQANIQAAESAKMSGGSAIPTQINTGVGAGGSCVICSDKSANVKNLLSDWVRQGKLTPDVADQLEGLASKNVSVDEYAAALDKLVKEGKLTPEQARQLLEEYKKQHGNAQLSDAEKMMDDMIKRGDLSIAAANELLDAQKKKLTPAEYAALLQKMVREGKISQAVANQLLQQYTKQCIEDSMQKHIVLINQMSSDGSLTQDVAKQLIELTKSNAAVEMYSNQLNSLVTQGKITPVAAGNLVDGYKQGKSACGSAGTIAELLQQAENEAYQELSDLLSAGKISPETAATLSKAIQNDIPMADYKALVGQLQQDKQLTPEIAQLKIGDYEKVKKLRDAQEQLAALQANNATPEDYAEALKRLVAAGVITPEQAAQLLQEYQALRSPVAQVPVAGGEFGKLQQKVQQGGQITPEMASSDFATAQAVELQETDQERKARLDAIMTAMQGQAGQLIAAWQPPVMVHKEGTPDTPVDTKGTGKNGTTEADAKSGGSTTGSTTSGSVTPALIKGGTIIFGVLDTAINSDYPDSPIMATVVDGKYKGAKLLGKIVTTKGVSGQLDRVSLNFTVMNVEEWPKSKTVTAYGIDPDTARTVMASTVDYHYMMRFGAMFATSFLQGYASAVTNAGTSTTGIFGTSTTHPELSPTEKLQTALGQVGQTIGAATQNYVNRPPTVRVDSGVSLGILFMTDVT